MRASTRRQLEDFAVHTLPYSKYLSDRCLRDWLDAFDRGKRRDLPGGRPDLLPHPGPIRPLDYQDELIASGTQSLTGGTRAVLLSLPTGAGKTFVAMRVLLNLMTEHNVKSVLWLAPQRVLLDQAAVELRRSWWSRSRSFGVRIIHDAERRRPAVGTERTIRFATLQGQSRQADLGVELVVIDECHYLETNRFGEVASRLRGAGATILGLTATPGRSVDAEMAALTEHFGGELLISSLLGSSPVAALQQRGVYADLRFRTLDPTFELDSEVVARKRGTGGARQVLFARSPGRLDAVVETTTSLSENNRALVFCYSVGHCHIVAAALTGAGVSVGLLAGELGDDHNRETLDQFRAGDIKVLVNAKYAAVGTDLPVADVALLTTPVGSPIFFEQVVGRVSRGPAVGGTSEATVFDFDRNVVRHQGVKSYARFVRAWHVSNL